MRSTVSSPEKARPATVAGGHHVLDYREGDPAAEIRKFAPDGVDIVAEVALGTNLALDLAVLRTRGTISAYANDGGKPVGLDMPQSLVLNARLQFLVLYTAGPEALATAVACETRNTFWYEPGIRQLITADGKKARVNDLGFCHGAGDENRTRTLRAWLPRCRPRFPLLRARCGHGFENGRQPRHVHQPAINMIEIKAIQPIKHFYAFRELLANSSEFTRINRNSNLFLRNMPATDNRRFPATENHRTGTIP